MRFLTGILLCLLAVAVLAACGTGDPQNGAQEGPTSSPEGDSFGEPIAPTEPPQEEGDAQLTPEADPPTTPEADTPATPDVVAIVDGEEIKGEEFDARLEQRKAGFQQQGMKLEGAQLEELQRQVLQGLVRERLLLQRAEADGVDVAGDEVEKEYQDLVQEVGSEEALHQAAEAQGIPPEDLRGVLEDGLKIDYLLEGVVEGADLEPPTEEEIQSMYDQLNEQYQGQLPPLEEVKEDIVAQLQAPERQEVVQSFVQDLEDESDVELLFLQ